MPFNPNIYHRRSIRLPDYDYTQDGAYFITICTHQRECLFGEIEDGEVLLSTLGCVVEMEWERTVTLRPYIQADAFVIMPNHVHAIIIINRANTNPPSVGAQCIVPDIPSAEPKTESFGKPIPDSIPTTVRAFKAACTRAINRIRLAPGAPVWQRNYYEHIVRNEASLNEIRQYIQQNPARWAEDQLYVAETL